MSRDLIIVSIDNIEGCSISELWVFLKLIGNEIFMRKKKVFDRVTDLNKQEGGDNEEERGLNDKGNE